MRKNILSLLTVLILISILFVFTGCSNNKEINDVSQELNNNTITSQKETISYLDYDRTGEFNEGIAVIHKTKDFKTTHYVIDQDFNVLFSYQGNSEFIGKYMKIADKDDEKKINILNEKGDIVYSYDDKEYKKEVELVENGCLIITEQSDTYNSSETVTGIYSLEEQKYILEPSSMYANTIQTYGEKMLLLNEEKTSFFNLETKTIVNYTDAVHSEFKDGYSVNDEYSNGELYLKIYDTNGNKKIIKNSYNLGIDRKKQANGMIFEAHSTPYMEGTNEVMSYKTFLYDIEKGSEKDLSNEIWLLENNVEYTTDGYALAKFSNKGGMTYYTIFDKEGNMVFEPQKRNNEAIFGAESNEEPITVKSDNLYEGNYFIVEENNVTKIFDKDNKEIVSAEEYETFVEITNNTIIVCYNEPGHAEKYYYKDLSGNNIGIKINGSIKEYN